MIKTCVKCKKKERIYAKFIKRRKDYPQLAIKQKEYWHKWNLQYVIKHCMERIKYWENKLRLLEKEENEILYEMAQDKKKPREIYKK